MIYIPIFVNIVLLLLFGYRYLFFSLILTLLYERIYEYGDKVKLRQPVKPYHQKKTIFGRISSIIFCGTSHSRAISAHMDAAWQTSSIIRAAF